MGMTKSQIASLARIAELFAAGPVDVTYGGIKGVNRSSLWALEDKGVITIERHTVPNRNYPNMFITAINN
jgi:hypothetical protein